MSIRSVALLLSAALAAQGQVTHNRLLNADKEPQNWLTYGGNFGGQRYSPLSQINATNVKDLHLQWAFQQRSVEKFESTPLVVDGTMYLTQAPNDIFALDAVTGEIKWMYSYSPSRESRPCCGRVNRGVAIFGNTLFMATIDAHLVAVNARDGKLLWDKEVAKAESGYAMTHAPLVIKGKVIVGVAGAEFGIRGFIAAYDSATGNEAWRFYTIPGKGEPGNETWAGDSWMHGGASVWVTGTYDPETNLTFWGTGNPGPDYNSDKRGGDNLYSDSVVALDADTGKLKWYFQFTPHDDYDYDSTQVPVLANVDWPDASGRKTPRKVMLWGNRNGFFYALDRVNGKYLKGTPFVKVTWTRGLDEAGRPMRINGVVPTAEGVDIYPSATGGTNWFSPSFSPRTQLFYVNAWDGVHSNFKKIDVEYQEGNRFTGGVNTPTRPGVRGPQLGSRNEADGTGYVRALDPVTGDKKWEYKMNDTTQSGILTTGSDLLFTGGREGYFQALDARTGKLLWRVNAGGDVAMGPISYSVNGKQYIVFSASSSMFVYALR
ncbi:MAG: PQQ-dependent dehydrogenase, methanol/ethanol family [Bryobacterales bacterium]|nr:PQQ-dependent dehydrogenase, methanol/ethanol family [Bryobacterales bacterium]